MTRSLRAGVPVPRSLARVRRAARARLAAAQGTCAAAGRLSPGALLRADGALADDPCLAQRGAGVGVDPELCEHLVVVLTEGRGGAGHPAVDMIEAKRHQRELDPSGHRVVFGLEQSAVPQLGVEENV